MACPVEGGEPVTARDTQRQRLYDAQGGCPRGRELPTVPDLQTYVDRVLTSRWFLARWGHWGGIQVKSGAGRRSACAEGRHVIKMPLWSRCERVTLHEVAHCLTPAKYAAHGPEFAGVMLALVRQQMGPDAAKALRTSFREKRVRVSSAAVPPPSRTVVPVTVVKARERAAASLPPTRMATAEAAGVLRRAIKNGWFGASGTKTRDHALATARELERRA